MKKTILITGSTDGIGLLTAKRFADEGHNVLLHGRSSEKLEAAKVQVGGSSECYLADLSNMEDVIKMADGILAKHDHLDVLINNAGILKTPNPITAEGLDIRFVVNTFAPYILTKRLLPIIPMDGRIVNLSSAAQQPIELDAMAGERALEEYPAYAQSKLAITIWSREMAKELSDGPLVVAVNPGSLLASKMVKEGFGIEGNDLNIGVDILHEASLGDSFADATGKYYDNDAKCFNDPHPAAFEDQHSADVMQAIEAYAGKHGGDCFTCRNNRSR